MERCKHITGRKCEPTDCFLQSSAAAAANVNLINSGCPAELIERLEAEVDTAAYFAEKLRECALDVLKGKNEWVGRLYYETLEEVQERRKKPKDK